tara:strand:+ start:74807 stop:80668 length:5862 start_codon:yes stop_codon:yes gene_type:complete
MLRKIQKSRFFKGLALCLVLNFLSELFIPTLSFALTGGPAQPEFNSFTPVGTSDMVDLSSGDFSYNIPLMDVGGYPLNLAYSSGVTMDQEASWVGLGWDLSVGQINRNVRGIPDDFNGDEINYKNNLKDNVTVGASFNFQPAIAGFDLPLNLGEVGEDGLSVGVSLNYNNYNGFSIKPSAGISADLGKRTSVGLSVESGPDGLTVDPNLSMHAKSKTKHKRLKNLNLGIGTSFNSRQGISAMSLSMSKRSTYEVTHKGEKFTKSKKGNIGSTIGFTDMVYTPELRTKKNTGSFTVNAAIGAEFFGGEGQGQVTAYGTVQKLANSEKDKDLKAYGYAHTDLADQDAVLDINREKDGNFSVNSTNLPLTNYTYDIYSIQGQGVGGMFRPYRNQVGYVYDDKVKDLSLSGTLGLEFGTGNAVHVGVDGEGTVTNGESGLWEDDNPSLSTFEETYNNQPDYEKVMYKNVGDLSTDQEIGVLENEVGGYQPVRVKVGGSKFNRSTKKTYEKKVSTPNGTGYQQLGLPSDVKRSGRQLRNQSILNLSIDELINGDGIGQGPIAKNNYPVHSSAKSHHTGEVQITRNDGARYIYGIPAYNTIKKETTFAVEGGTGNCNTGLVSYSPGTDNSVDNPHGDKFFNQITTPGYAHSYLLTSVLSTDYQDRSGDGPTKDDLGSYTKFTYESLPNLYNWRMPYSKNGNEASYSEGMRTEMDDDQGNYTYGQKEIKYVKTVETKTHIAVFTYSSRKDAVGVLGENGGIGGADQQLKKVKSISLYSLPEYEADPNNAIPIKTVHFEYSYDLCPNIPNNNGQITDEISNDGGKLTLKEVYFTYRNSKMGRYTGYQFNYDNLNPDYNQKAYDIWGCYKENTGSCNVLGNPTAPEFNYVEQDDVTHDYTSAWTMSSIDLPSGGTISVEYESDDYAYVQDKKAHRMFKVVGAGREDTPNSTHINSDETAFLYDNQLVNDHNMYLYVEVDDKYLNSPGDFYNDHISPLEKELVYFRFFTNLTKSGAVDGSGFPTPEPLLNGTKFEYVSGYCKIDEDITYNVSQVGNKTYASVPIELVEKEGGVTSNQKVNPIAKAAWNFGRKYLSKHVYSANPNGNNGDIETIVYELLSPNVINNLLEVFQGPNGRLQSDFIGQRFVKQKSWIRLAEPSGKKLGGGCRVREVIMSDIWTEMNDNDTDFKTMNYGQTYEYELTNGKSSGVATYEPVGSKENPIVQPVFSTTEHILAPDEENYVEKPFGESFYPNPQVTYSRVKVQNREAGSNSDAGLKVKDLHRTGYVVTEFYTSKDYPTIVDQTELDATEDKTNALGNLLNINIRKHLTATQGYVIHLNDMNGKEKSQRVFAEGQEDFISGVDYKYDGVQTPDPSNPFGLSSANRGKMNNDVKVILPNGDVTSQKLGVEYDVINDFRENSTTTTTVGINGNTAAFFVGVIPGIIPMLFPDYARSSDQFRSVSTTKVINTFGILKETIAYDAGASVSTRNLAWDALTGEVLVTETVDEYNDKYYSFSYPAHWYYDGMGLASENIGLDGQLVNISSNEYQISNVAPYVSSNFLIEGDELKVDNGSNYERAWVVDLNGNDFKLIDRDGNPVIISGTPDFRVIRSGRRNLQSSGVSNVTLMQNPLKDLLGNDVSNLSTSFLVSDINNDWRIIEAGAVDYSDNWPPQCECGININEDVYNPYTINEKGVWRTKSSHTYLTGRQNLDDPTPRVDGYYKDYSPFYKLSNAGSWYKDYSGWTFTSEVSSFSPYGFELENRDALDRHSGAQYGYNHTYPMAVGANTKYREIGYDGFEDYNFDGCDENQHFSFKGTVGLQTTQEHFHTGRHSAMVVGNSSATLSKKITCDDNEVECHIIESFDLTINPPGHPGLPWTASVFPNIVGGQQPYTYTWHNFSTTGDFSNSSVTTTSVSQDGSTFTINYTDDAFNNPPQGSFCVTVTVTDSQGCEVTDTFCHTVAQP